MKRYDAREGIPTLAAALSECMKATELRKLATLTGSRIPGRKPELVSLILQHLRGDRLRTVWRGLDELQKAAVAEVVHSSGTRFPADRFRAKYGRDPDWGSVDEYRHDESPTALQFFFYGNYVMPEDVKERLETFVPPPAEAEVSTLDQLPAVHDLPYARWNNKKKMRESGVEKVPMTIRESERAAQRELFSILRLVDAGKIAVSEKTRRPSTMSRDAITAVLEDGDFYAHKPPKNKWHDENAGPIRAFAWPMLIQAGGLAQRSGSRLRLTKSGRKVLSGAAAETIQKLWEKWIGTTVLDELSRIDCVKGQTGKGKRGLTAVSGRREAIADALAGCPAVRWIDIGEFFRFVRASGNDFAVARSAWGLYIAEPHYGSLGYEGCERFIEERYLLCLLLEYAATLGLIDVAYIPPAGARRDYHRLWGTDDLPYLSRYDGLLYFRINALGACCLGIAPAYEPPPVETKPLLRVLPNLEIAAIGDEIGHGDRLALDAYAVRVSDRTWRLDTAKLLKATEGGRTVEEIREFLAARSAAALPDTVVHLIESVAERSACVHDRGLVRLVECAEPVLAALIANDSRTRKHCMQAGECHLIVPAASETAFRRALRDLGYLLASGESGAAKPRSVKKVGVSGSRRSKLQT